MTPACAQQETRFGGFLFARASAASRWLAALGVLVATASAPAIAQDLEREARWARETLATLLSGEAVRIPQANGHRFLAIYQAAARLPSEAANPPPGAAIIAHGRGWGPDVDLYGALRTDLAEAGWSTLSIQLPVLPGTAKLGDYVPTYPDADERFALAVDWLRQRGHTRVAIVSHSLGATMANHYLVRTQDGKVGAWVYLGILNGLDDMFRIKIPVLDVYAERDWEVIRVGADERRKQIERIAGSRQVMVAGAQHFYEDQREPLKRLIVEFLDAVMPAPQAGPAAHKP